MAKNSKNNSKRRNTKREAARQRRVDIMKIQTSQYEREHSICIEINDLEILSKVIEMRSKQYTPLVATNTNKFYIPLVNFITATNITPDHGMVRDLKEAGFILNVSAKMSLVYWSVELIEKTICGIIPPIHFDKCIEILLKLIDTYTDILKEYGFKVESPTNILDKLPIPIIELPNSKLSQYNKFQSGMERYLKEYRNGRLGEQRVDSLCFCTKQGGTMVPYMNFSIHGAGIKISKEERKSWVERIEQCRDHQMKVTIDAAIKLRKEEYDMQQEVFRRRLCQKPAASQRPCTSVPFGTYFAQTLAERLHKIDEQELIRRNYASAGFQNVEQGNVEVEINQHYKVCQTKEDRVECCTGHVPDISITVEVFDSKNEQKESTTNQDNKLSQCDVPSAEPTEDNIVEQKLNGQSSTTKQIKDATLEVDPDTDRNSDACNEKMDIEILKEENSNCAPEVVIHMYQYQSLQEEPVEIFKDSSAQAIELEMVQYCTEDNVLNYDDEQNINCVEESAISLCQCNSSLEEPVEVLNEPAISQITAKAVELKLAQYCTEEPVFVLNEDNNCSTETAICLYQFQSFQEEPIEVLDFPDNTQVTEQAIELEVVQRYIEDNVEILDQELMELSKTDIALEFITVDREQEDSIEWLAEDCFEEPQIVKEFFVPERAQEAPVEIFNEDYSLSKQEFVIEREVPKVQEDIIQSVEYKQELKVENIEVAKSEESVNCKSQRKGPTQFERVFASIRGTRKLSGQAQIPQRTKNRKFSGFSSLMRFEGLRTQEEVQSESRDGTGQDIRHGYSLRYNRGSHKLSFRLPKQLSYRSLSRLRRKSKDSEVLSQSFSAESPSTTRPKEKRSVLSRIWNSSTFSAARSLVSAINRNSNKHNK
ncbi:hypothetical protein ACOME3_004948 [Neoechinorhynchus agilis]